MRYFFGESVFREQQREALTPARSSRRVRAVVNETQRPTHLGALELADALPRSLAA
jgi:hypothetical protein